MPSRSRPSSSNAPAPRAALALVALVTAAALPAAGMAAEHVVAIDGVRFDPAALTVNAGDTVAWVNKDPFPHTVTDRGVFDSKEIATGKSWKWTARKPGVYEYVCTLHPTMKGTVTVK